MGRTGKVEFGHVLACRSEEVCDGKAQFITCKYRWKTAYEMLISDWSSDVCSSDLRHQPGRTPGRRSAVAGAGHRNPRRRRQCRFQRSVDRSYAAAMNG